MYIYIYIYIYYIYSVYSVPVPHISQKAYFLVKHWIYSNPPRITCASCSLTAATASSRCTTAPGKRGALISVSAIIMKRDLYK